MRQSMDPAGLEDLAESIRAVGVLLPLLVHQEGGRFRIDDGHRRYIAAARAGLEVVPVMVRDVKAISGEAVKCHANYHREDVNPAEEAQYLAVVSSATAAATWIRSARCCGCGVSMLSSGCYCCAEILRCCACWRSGGSAWPWRAS